MNKRFLTLLAEKPQPQPGQLIPICHPKEHFLCHLEPVVQQGEEEEDATLASFYYPHLSDQMSHVVTS